MLSRLLRRFAQSSSALRSTQRSAAPATSAVPGAPSMPPAAAVSTGAAAPSSALRAPEPDDRALHAVLRGAVDAACAEMADAIPAGAAAGDALLVLADLMGDAQALIRQPPAAAQEALAAVRDPDVDLLDLVRVFEKDPLLAQALLRRANASWYATSTTPCVSIRDGVRRVGLEGVHGVLVAAMVEGMLCRPGGAYEAMVQQVWTHMVRTAPLARRLAPCFDLPVDQAFTLALLHDVGKLVVFDRLAALRVQQRRTLQLGTPLLGELLRRVHEPLGGLAVLRWELGAAAARAVATHHRAGVRYEGERWSQVLCLAERADLAQVRGVELDVPTVWLEAGLSGGRDAAARAMAELAAAAAAASSAAA